MCRAFSRRFILFFFALSACASTALGQGVDPNIVNRIDTFLPPQPQKVLPEKKEKVEVKKTEHFTEVVEEKKQLTLAEREAKAKDMGIAVPLGLRATNARSAYLNFRRVPKETVTKVTKHKTRVVTKTVEKAVPRTVHTALIGSLNDTYANNASQTPVPVADFTNAGSVNLQVLIPIGPQEDTIALSLGPTSVRYIDLTGDSFDMVAANVRYSKVLGTSYSSEYKTGGTGTTDILSFGLGGVSVFDPGFDESQINILSPSIVWSRNNIGLGPASCGAPGNEAYCTYASVVVTLWEGFADESDQNNSSAVIQTTLGWQTPIQGLSLSATGSVQGTNYWDYPGGRQDLILVGIGSLSWDPRANVNVSAGVQFTEQASTQADLDWRGFSVLPALMINVRLN
jgi:hypothetical protein